MIQLDIRVQKTNDETDISSSLIEQTGMSTQISRVIYDDRSKNKTTRLNRFKVNQNFRSKDSFATYSLINYYFPKLKWICHFSDEGQCSGPSGLA